jgi:hypothetical protein
VPLVLRIHFPDDFPFAPPLVYCTSPVLKSEYVFDGALCMEMLVDWQPTYGNVETMLVQITACAYTLARAFTLCLHIALPPCRHESLLPHVGRSSMVKSHRACCLPQHTVLSHSNARVASCVLGSSSAENSANVAGQNKPGLPKDDDSTEEKARRAYASLKAFHAKKGWSHHGD